MWPTDPSCIMRTKLDIIVSCASEENSDWILEELHVGSDQSSC